MSDGTIQCGGFTSSPINGMLGVVVGNGIACGYQDGVGVPTSCSYLSNSNCTNPYVDAAVYCWSNSAQTFADMIVMKTTAQLGFNNYYDGGPTDIRLDISGRICIDQAVYSRLSSPEGMYLYTYTVCGTSVTAGGDLQ